MTFVTQAKNADAVAAQTLIHAVLEARANLQTIAGILERSVGTSVDFSTYSLAGFQLNFRC